MQFRIRYFISAPSPFSRQIAYLERRKTKHGHTDLCDVLQFVQMLANPRYLNHLATQKLFDNEEFVAYLQYLQYFRQPKYIRYLQ